MRTYKVLLVSFLATAALGLSSCVSDLDVTPIDPTLQLPGDVLDSEQAYYQILAKCYQGLAVSASDGQDSDPDIDGIDGGFGQYIRALFNLQCLTTDEALCVWNDDGLPDLNYGIWSSSNQFISAMYYRIFFQIGLCNELIRQIGINPGNLTEADFPHKNQFIAEARALRALSYYHALDLFGNVPFSTEYDSVGSSGPVQISRADLFAWVVNECQELLNGTDLAEAKQNIYGRCDKGMVRMILAKLYLNAETWIGEAKWSECAALCRQVMQDYPLHATYADLFCADNHLWTANTTYGGDEIIFVVEQDGINIRSYGCTNFIIRAGGGSALNMKLGSDDLWGGLSLRKEFSEKFSDSDTRKIFNTEAGISIDDPTIYSSTDASVQCGYKSMKFTNINHDGSKASDANFVDTDFPLFRAADAYLMLAECALHNAASQTDGQDALNAVRKRAGLGSLTLTADNLLDERAREFYWECTRRQDLIRFGKFTSGYNWQYKGGNKEGADIAAYRNLFPLPPEDINANGNLTQNEGY